MFAVAHVRGGGEMGRRWYDEGKTLAKRTTFTDFVAVARHLVDAGWTSPERLVAQGGSAGGSNSPYAATARYSPTTNSPIAVHTSPIAR